MERRKMEGRKYAGREIWFYFVWFLAVLGTGIFFVWRAYEMSYKHKGLEKNEVVFLAIFFVSFVYLLNKIITKMGECYSDYLDYCDIEDIKNNGVIKESYEEKTFKDDFIQKKTIEADKNINNEIWNNINRRAEKAKMVSLSSMQLREIKDLMVDIIKKMGVK